MVSNSTNDGTEYLWKYVVYIAEGGITSIANIFLFFTIIRYKALSCEKVYIIVGGLTLADALNCLAYFVCGIYRTSLVINDHHTELVSHWDCMLKAHNIIWAFSDTISSLMLLVVSVDRFVSVRFPLRYLGMPVTYSYSLVGVAYGYTLISGLYAIYISSTLPDGNKWSALCFTSMAIGPIYSKYLASFFIFGLFSIVGYVMIWFTYYRKAGQVVPNQIINGAEAKQKLKNQRKVTKSLGLSCVFTLFLYVLPMFMNSLSTAVDYSATGLTVIPLYAFMWSNLNPLLNVVIFYIRHKEIRFAMKNLLIFKELPGDMRLWNMKKVNKKNQQTIKLHNKTKGPINTLHA